MVKVLFVCTGNICRSPTAEGVFRRLVEEAGLSHAIAADLAGTHGYHVGEPPDPRSRQAARTRGVDLSALRARKLVAADFTAFDHILALDHGHLAHIRRMAPPNATAAVGLFLAEGGEVPDPYYGEADGFETVLDLCEQGARALLDRIRRETAPGSA